MPETVSQPRDAAARQALLALADQCVMCGLCVPRCPTYRVRAEEGESPRGRVALARAFLAGKVEADAPGLQAHLDQCLACGICEGACPSSVRYLDLLVGTRAQLRGDGGDGGASSRRLPVWRRPAAARWLARLARWLPEALIGLARSAAQRLPDLARWLVAAEWARAMPASALDAALPHPAEAAVMTAPAKTVAIFAGCGGGSFDRDTLAAAVAVLQQMGYRTYLIGDGSCCGALDRHGGRLEAAGAAAAGAADDLARVPGIDVVIHVDSGCHADVAAVGARLGKPVALLDSFIAQALSERCLPPAKQRPSSPLRVALHTPCTRRRVADPTAAARLLAAVPAVMAEALQGDDGCCGAAGTYAIDHPDIAGRLRDRTIARIVAMAPDRVVTGNLGCRLQLQAGLRAAGLDIPVQHPVTLLRDILLP